MEAMRDESVKLAEKIIKEIRYITIATATRDGKPWNSPVYSAYDEGYNFYWMSQMGSQHSKNISENPDVFLVIYNSKVAEGTGKGVYVRATASEVFDEKEIEKALAIMWGRVGKDPKAHKSSEFLGNSPLRVYKAVPKKFWINDDERFEGKYLDFRVEVDLLGNK